MVQTLQNQAEFQEGSGCLGNIDTNYRIEKKDKSFQGVGFIISNLQKVVREICFSKKVRACSTFALNRDCELRTDKNGGKARFSGTNKCLNTTICPTCSQMLSVCRAKQINDVCVPIIKDGGEGFMLTLTIPHLKKDSFQKLQRQLNTCWARLMRQKFGKKVASYNNNSKPLWVKSFDYTMTNNGNHNHFHVLIMVENKISDQEYEELKILCRNKWGELVKKITGREISNQHGVVFERVWDLEGVTKYNNKISSVAFEIASRGSTKRSNKNSMNIMELIYAIQTEQDEDRRNVLIKKFRIFEKQTHKLKTITYSKCFRARIEDYDKEKMIEEREEKTNLNLKIRKDLFSLMVRKDDTANLLELYNCYSTGDIHLKPIIEAVERVCEKYNSTTCYMNEKQMEKDWGKVAFRIRKWIFYRFKPEFYHYNPKLLI